MSKFIPQGINNLFGSSNDTTAAVRETASPRLRAQVKEINEIFARRANELHNKLLQSTSALEEQMQEIEDAQTEQVETQIQESSARIDRNNDQMKSQSIYEKMVALALENKSLETSLMRHISTYDKLSLEMISTVEQQLVDVEIAHEKAMQREVDIASACLAYISPEIEYQRHAIVQQNVDEIAYDLIDSNGDKWLQEFRTPNTFEAHRHSDDRAMFVKNSMHWLEQTRLHDPLVDDRLAIACVMHSLQRIAEERYGRGKFTQRWNSIHTKGYKAVTDYLVERDKHSLIAASIDDIDEFLQDEKQKLVDAQQDERSMNEPQSHNDAPSVSDETLELNLGGLQPPQN